MSSTLPKQLQWLCLLTVTVNASAMLSPIIDSGDAVIYASISRHIALSHDWVRLVLDGRDWLDKPHLPFWITALSFDLGGVSALTYILPGFLFHLMGAYYTYRLARLLHDPSTAALSVLIYVSIFNLMDSSIEVKAEAYLGAEILAASFYWLQYDREGRTRYLFLGALFTAMAIMTKGIFSLVTIFSGLACVWAYQGRRSNGLRIKWLAALASSLLLAAPELIALHLQFPSTSGGAAPAPHGSVLRFFFWDSQFGRFFNTGPIQNHNGYPLYYVFVMLWGFLPWTLVFLAAIYREWNDFGRSSGPERVAFVFLIGTFSCTFMLFSATRFQMTYYIDIILPFAAILTARYLAQHAVRKPLFATQMGLIAFLALLTLGLGLYVMNPVLLGTTAALCAGLLCYGYATRAASRNFRLIACSVLAINILYVFSIQLSELAFTRSSIANNAGKAFAGRSELPIYVYRMPEVSRELALYSKAPIYALDTADSLANIRGRYHVIAQHEQARRLQSEQPHLSQILTMNLVVHKTGTLDKLLRLAKGSWPMEAIDFLEYGAH